MRVLHVTPYFAPAFCYGGPPRSIFGLSRSLQRVGVDVQVFTTTANGNTDLPASRPDGDRYEGIPVRYFLRTFPRRWFSATGLASALATTIRDYDLVHLHGLWNFPVWYAATYARRCGIPYVISPRGMLERAAVAHRQGRKHLAYWLIERRNLAGATFLHATSDAEAQRLHSYGFRVPIMTVPNGVVVRAQPIVPPSSFRHRLGLDENTQIVTFIGRLHAIKRLDLLIAAFRQVQRQIPNVHLVIAGPEESGAASSVWRREQAANPAIHRLGELKEEEKWSLLSESAAFALCSDSESFGMSVVEAMAAGVPVVVTHTCPWQEVETVGCGLWVPQQPDAVATALHWLLTHPTEARQMGGRGRGHAHTRYAWEPIARTMATYYANALAECSRVQLAS